MQIYFAASIRGGREDLEIYQQLIQELQQYGTVLTEHIGAANLTPSGEKNLSDKRIFIRDLNWLEAADVVVAEVSQPSLGVGYEIACAESLEKKVLCLFRSTSGRRLSAMIAGNPNINNRTYTDFADAQQILQDFFSSRKL